MKPNLELGDTRRILDVCRSQSVPLAQAAYVLATAYWETARTMRPVEEAFYLGRRAEAYRQGLRYYPWHGRGYVQLTWQRNYIHAGKRLDVDLTTDPDAAMNPAVASRILVVGMVEGWFTGKKLADYINAKGADYVGARRIINGTDKAREIAAIAEAYAKALTDANWTPSRYSDPAPGQPLLDTRVPRPPARPWWRFWA